MGLVRYIFEKIAGANVFLSRRICQDPLEKFFGCQRQIGGMHDNPSVKEFQQNTQSLRVVNSFCREVAKGNCRGNGRKRRYIMDKSDSIPLPKRQKSKSGK